MPLEMLLLQDLGQPEMTTSAWVFMGLGWVFVIGLATFCFRRVLGGGPDE